MSGKGGFLAMTTEILWVMAYLGFAAFPEVSNRLKSCNPLTFAEKASCNKQDCIFHEGRPCDDPSHWIKQEGGNTSLRAYGLSVPEPVGSSMRKACCTSSTLGAGKA